MTETPTLSRDLTERQARWFLFALIAASTLGFSYLAYRKYACFNWETSDSAVFGYAFFQTLHGRFFPFFAGAGGFVSQRPNFIVTAWLPVFRLVPTMGSLFLFQSLMISLAAWPVYLLARDKIGNRITALTAAAGVLVYPPIVGQHVNQIHDDQFGLALLLFALFFFEARHFGKFSSFLLLSLFAKETIALTTFLFGVYALMCRREWKWIVMPLTCSVIYLGLVLRFLMPLMGGFGHIIYSNVSYFSDYGNTPGEVLRFLINNPARMLGIAFSADRMGYLIRLLLPLLVVLPFGNAAWLLALPSLSVNLLSSNRLLRDPTWHYNLISGGLLWASFVMAAPFWSRKLAHWSHEFDCTRSLYVTALLLSALSCGSWLIPSQYYPTPLHAVRVEAIKVVPVESSVLSPENMLAHFAAHPAINSLGMLRYYNCDPNQVFDYDYIVFDATYPSPDWQAQSSLFALISALPEYRVVFSRDNVFVFQRVGIPKRLLKW